MRDFRVKVVLEWGLEGKHNPAQLFAVESSWGGEMRQVGFVVS